MAKSVLGRFLGSLHQTLFDGHLARLAGHLDRPLKRDSLNSVWIEADLRALFYLDGNAVVSIEIGNHKIYRS